MKPSNRRIFLLAMAALLIGANPARAEDVVVIMNKENTSPMDLAYVAKIYSGALKAWPDGSPVFALDLPEDSEVRVQFSIQVLNRSVANMRAIWSQNIFTGKAHPPRIVTPESEIKKLVGTNRNAIGYIRASLVDASVRVIAR